MDLIVISRMLDPVKLWNTHSFQMSKKYLPRSTRLTICKDIIRISIDIKDLNNSRRLKPYSIRSLVKGGLSKKSMCKIALKCLHAWKLKDELFIEFLLRL